MIVGVVDIKFEHFMPIEELSGKNKSIYVQKLRLSLFLKRS